VRSALAKRLDALRFLERTLRFPDARAPEGTGQEAPGHRRSGTDRPLSELRAISPEMRHAVDTAMQAALIDISDHPPKCPRRRVYHEPPRRRRDDLATVRLAAKRGNRNESHVSVGGRSGGPRVHHPLAPSRARLRGQNCANRKPPRAANRPFDSVTSSFRKPAAGKKSARAAGSGSASSELW
jgi:hypothetical protein